MDIDDYEWYLFDDALGNGRHLEAVNIHSAIWVRRKEREEKIIATVAIGGTVLFMFAFLMVHFYR